MAATVNLYESNGGTAGSPASVTLLTNLNFSNADTANTTVSAVSNPLVIPVSGTRYSLTKWIRVGVTSWGSPPSAQIGNLKIWNSTGSPWATTKGIGASNGVIGSVGYANVYITSYGHKVAGAGAVTIPDSGGSAVSNQGQPWSFSANQIAASAVNNLGTSGALATNLLYSNSSSGTVVLYSDYMALGMWFTSAVATGDAGAQTISYAYDES